MTILTTVTIAVEHILTLHKQRVMAEDKSSVRVLRDAPAGAAGNSVVIRHYNGIALPSGPRCTVRQGAVFPRQRCHQLQL
jgi:hypothetical protein